MIAIDPKKMGRPAGDVKPRLIEAATQLIVNQGFAATSVDQICEKSKATKGGFFHHFESKEALALVALDRFHEDRANALSAYLANRSTNPLERLLAHVDFVTVPEATRFKGCLVGVLAIEVSRTHAKIRAKCEEKFSLWDEVFQTDLRAVLPDLDSKKIGDFSRAFISTFEGALILAKCSGNPAQVRDALAHFKTVLNAFVNSKRKKL